MKEEGRRKKEERRRKKEEGRRTPPLPQGGFILQQTRGL